MSPIVDIQKAWADTWRLRLGDTVATDSGKTRPRKLTDCMRITSPAEGICRAFAEQYGGDVELWPSLSGQQWQVYIPVTELPVMLLPGQSLSQWWEKWDRSVCARRCDGVTEQVSGEPCKCPADIDARMADRHACRPTTRLWIVCPEVAVLGAGMLVSHGLIAAQTLPSSIVIAEAALARGVRLPAVLRLVEHKGRTHFVVPRLELVGMSLLSLEAGSVPDSLGPAPRAELPSARNDGEEDERTEMGRLASPSVPSEMATRAPSAAQEGPQTAETGQNTRAADAWDVEALRAKIEAHDAEIRAAIKERWRFGSLRGGQGEDLLLEADVVHASNLIAEVASDIYARRRKRANARMGTCDIKSDDARHALVAEATGGDTQSTAKLTAAQLSAIEDACSALEREETNA